MTVGDRVYLKQRIPGELAQDTEGTVVEIGILRNGRRLVRVQFDLRTESQKHLGLKGPILLAEEDVEVSNS